LLTKRLIIYCVLFLFVFASTADSQSSRRSLELTSSPHPNQPIEIVSREVGGEKVPVDGKLIAGPDWVSHIALTIKNTSGKAILFFQIGIVVEGSERVPYKVVFPMRFGVPFWADANGKPKVSDKSKILAPCDYSVVTVTGDDAKAFTDRLKAYGADNFSNATVVVEEVQFYDGTGWSYGYEWRRDPANLNIHIPKVVGDRNIRVCGKKPRTFYDQVEQIEVLERLAAET
jgi:hypothetical protein